MFLLLCALEPKHRILGTFGLVLHAFIPLEIEFLSNSCCVRKLPLSVAHALAENATPVDLKPVISGLAVA